MSLKKVSESFAFKIVLTGILSLALLIPLTMVSGIVTERESRRASAVKLSSVNMIRRAPCRWRSRISAVSEAGESASPRTWGSRRARLALTATIMGSGLAFLDGSVIAVASPHIADDLAGGLVAHDRRRFQTRIPVVKHPDVRAAHRARPHTDDNAVVVRRRRLHLSDGKTLQTFQHGRLHDTAPSL